eukprot:1001576-Amphidinium_carterae.1
MRNSPNRFTEQGLSNTLWAAATLKVDKTEIEPVIAAVADRMKKRPDKFIEQGLSNTLWAATTLKVGRAEIEPVLAA